MKSRNVTLTSLIVASLAVSLWIIPSAHSQGQAPAEAGRGGRGGARGGTAQAAGARGARGGVGTTPPPTSPVTGNAADGKKLYYEYSCYACHGFNGETGRAFVGSWANLQTEAGFLAFLRLRADRAPDTPATQMPNFPESTLSDKKAKDIYAYIRTFKSNSPELKDIPTLNAIVNSASRPYKP
jgi:mono/diheme cytochrome c family protein